MGHHVTSTGRNLVPKPDDHAGNARSRPEIHFGDGCSVRPCVDDAYCRSRRLHADGIGRANGRIDLLGHDDQNDGDRNSGVEEAAGKIRSSKAGRNLYLCRSDNGRGRHDVAWSAVERTPFRHAARLRSDTVVASVWSIRPAALVARPSIFDLIDPPRHRGAIILFPTG